MTELTYYNATHRLRCGKGLGRSWYEYHQRCHILKEMPDGKRYKVLTFGYQNSADCMHIKHIRYVNKDRVVVPKPAVYEPVRDEIGEVIFKNSDTSGHPSCLGA